MATILGTRAEYLADPSTQQGTLYHCLAVRYWDVFDDGTRLLREDWSSWTGTIDLSLVTPANCVGVVFAKDAPPGAEPPPNSAAIQASLDAVKALLVFKAAAAKAQSLGVTFAWHDGEPVNLSRELVPSLP